MREDLHQANRRSWNAATVAHNSHKGDQAAFFLAGGSTLFPEERQLLGDVAGRDLLHLQCNAGQDSLSLAQLGARVTGVDISDEAIAFAQQLSRDSGVAARFERADLYAWFERAQAQGRQFDLVFASYGTICWLSDLDGWARGIAQVLRPGGRFVFVEYHPAGLIFDQQWQPRYDYFNREPLAEGGVGDYVAETHGDLALDGYETGVRDFVNPHPSYEFTWGLGQVVGALLAAGLTLEHLEEYPYANGWRAFDRMQVLEGRRFAPPEDMPGVPLMYSLAARS